MRPVDPKKVLENPPLSWGYFPAIFDSRRILSPPIEMSGYRVFFFGIFQIPPQFRNIYLLFRKTKKHPDDTTSFRIIPIVERGMSEHRIEPPNLHCLNMLETFIFPMFLRPLFENALKSPHFQVPTCAWPDGHRGVVPFAQQLLLSRALDGLDFAEKRGETLGFMVDEY